MHKGGRMPGKAKGPNVRVYAYIRPPELAAELQAIAFLEGVPVSELLTQAASLLVAKKKKQHGKGLEAILRVTRRA